MWSIQSTIDRYSIERLYNVLTYMVPTGWESIMDRTGSSGTLQLGGTADEDVADYDCLSKVVPVHVSPMQTDPSAARSRYCAVNR